MPDLFDRIHGEIRARLAESEAAKHETELLEAALAALDGAGLRVERSLPSTPRAARTRPRAEATAKRAPRGANRQAALRVIGERPGSDVGELVAATGIKRGVLYGLLARLVDDGEIVKQSTVDGLAGYAPAPATVDLPVVTDATLETPVTDDPVELQGDGDPLAEAAPEDVGVAEVTEAASATPGRTRRRAKAKPAAAEVSPPAALSPDSAEVQAPAGDAASNAPDAIAGDEPVAGAPKPKPKPKRRAAKPRPSRRGKPKPRPAS
jgi:hypothetical protein